MRKLKYQGNKELNLQLKILLRLKLLEKALSVKLGYVNG